MSVWTLRFDGGGLLDFLRLRRPARAAPHTAHAWPPAEREVSERRSEAMRGFFPKLASWYEQSVTMARMREVDRYLARSSDLADLERRIREVERRSSGRWF